MWTTTMYFNSYKYNNQHIVVTYGILFIMCTELKHPYTTAKADRETQTACKKTATKQASIPLNCSSNQMIHVISETFGERTSEDNCNVVFNSPTKSYTIDSNGLIVTCNGREKCTERTVCGKECNFSRPAAEIKYECVTGSKDICSKYNETGSLTSLYLHSPGYPNSVGVNHSCVCIVTGSALELMMIHHRITIGVLQINVTGNETETWTSYINRYNRIITNNAREIIVVYDNNGNDNQQFWIRISGNIKRTECSTLKNTSDVSTQTTNTTITTQETSRLGSYVSESTIDVNTTDTTEINSTYSDTTQGTDQSSLSDDMNTTDTTENNSIYSTTIQETGPPESSPSDDINTTDTTENNYTYSDTTQGTGRPESSPSADSTLSSAVVIAAVFGGIIVVTVLLTITVFVCRKKGTPRKDLGDFQMDENNAYGESETEVDPVSSHNDYLEPRQSHNVESCVGGFDVEVAIKAPKDQCDDLGEDTGMVTNDIYHSYQRKSEATGQQISTVNKGDNKVDSEETKEVNHLSHTLNESQKDDMHAAVRSGYGTVSDEAISVCSDEENVIVTNDLYHTYQQTKEQETSRGPASLEDDNDSIVVDNDLYKSITAKL